MPAGAWPRKDRAARLTAPLHGQPPAGGKGEIKDIPQWGERIMSTKPDIDWTGEIVASLRQLWAEGHSMREIGRRLGVSKNAVAGKAHRLNLSSRPSPFGTSGNSKPSRPRQMPVPPLPEPMPETGAIAPTEPPPGQRQQAPRTSATGPPPAPAPRMPNPPTAVAGNRPCCWPLGEPGRAGFRFCDRPAEAGRPYCTEHCGTAYVRPRQACGERAKNPR